MQSVNQLPQKISNQIERNGKSKQRNEGESHLSTPDELQFLTMPWPEVDFMFRGNCGGYIRIRSSRGLCKPSSGHGLFQRQVSESVED